MASRPLPKPTNSVPARIEMPGWLHRFMLLLDPDYPAAIVAPPLLLIEDPARYGDERLKPDFVVADDQNFEGGSK